MREIHFGTIGAGIRRWRVCISVGGYLGGGSFQDVFQSLGWLIVTEGGRGKNLDMVSAPGVRGAGDWRTTVGNILFGSSFRTGEDGGSSTKKLLRSWAVGVVFFWILGWD